MNKRAVVTVLKITTDPSPDSFKCTGNRGASSIFASASPWTRARASRCTLQRLFATSFWSISKITGSIVRANLPPNKFPARRAPLARAEFHPRSERRLTLKNIPGPIKYFPAARVIRAEGTLRSFGRFNRENFTAASSGYVFPPRRSGCD